MSKLFSTRRVRVSLAGLSVMALGLAGCGGGSGGGRSNGGANSSLPNTVVTALTANNRLAVFNARTPGNVQQVTVSGLRVGEQLIGIDFRYPNTIFSGNVLYGLASLSGSYQLYQIVASSTNTATATAVGTQFTLSPALGTVAFDFNPAVDRIRLIDTATGRNLRLVPDTSAVAATDTTVAYDAADAGTGTTPLIAGAAYTNNDADAGTGTALYGIDTARGALVSVGDDGNATGTDTGVSPNTGRLFTVGTLTNAPGNGDVGFDITPSNLGADANRGLVAFASNAGGRPRLYEVSLTTGALTGGAFINVPAVAGVLDIAVTDFVTIAAAKTKSK